MDADAPVGRGGDLGGLTVAFDSFAAATVRLEREYAALRERIAALTLELEEKNRLLAASLERERLLEAEALRQSRLAAMGEMAAMRTRSGTPSARWSCSRASCCRTSATAPRRASSLSTWRAASRTWTTW